MFLCQNWKVKRIFCVYIVKYSGCLNFKMSPHIFIIYPFPSHGSSLADQILSIIQKQLTEKSFLGIMTSSFSHSFKKQTVFSRGQLPFQAFISTAARQAWGPPQTWLICPFRPSPVESAGSNHSPHFHLTDSYSSLQQILCWEHDPIIKRKEVKT